MSDNPGGDPEAELPERGVTFSQIVGYNITAYRKAIGLTQEELGERLGWTATTVSAAERSWDGKRVRKFDADELPRIAGALGVPVIALLLPPPDAGTAVRYLVETEPGRPDITSLLPGLASSYGVGTAALSAYRWRLMALGASKYDLVAAEADAGQILQDAKSEARFVLATAEGQAEQIAISARELMEAAAERDAREVFAGGDADAVEQVDRVIADVRHEAHEILERARRAAGDILTKARRASGQITSNARARALSLERDAQRRHIEAMGTLIQSRQELERRVDDLRAFEREYRRRFEAFLEHQLSELREAPPDSGVFPPLPEDRPDPASDESGP